MVPMKNLFFSSFLTVVFALLCLTGCAGKAGKLMESAQASYRVNDYEAALRDTVMALKHKPDYEKAQNFVPTFFKAAVEARQRKIKTLESSSDKFRWDGLVAEYKGLIEINTLVKSLPPLIHKKTKQRITFETQNYSVPLRQASEQAAETHYQEGIRIADSADNAETQKRAAKEFKKVQEYVSGYKDVISRYEQARSAGVKRMAILTFEDRSNKARAYSGLLETITDDIVTAVANNPQAAEFLDIISREELEHVMSEQNLSYTGRFDSSSVAGIGKVVGVHELLIGQITQILYTPPNPKREVHDRKDTDREVIGEEKYVDKNGKERTRNKYRTVNISARITHYTVSSSARIIGSYRIIDVKTGKVKSPQKFDTTHEFKAEWAKITGNSKALKYSDKHFYDLTKVEEQDAPIEDVMVLEAANKLSDELAKALIEYAR